MIQGRKPAQSGDTATPLPPHLGPCQGAPQHPAAEHLHARLQRFILPALSPPRSATRGLPGQVAVRLEEAGHILSSKVGRKGAVSARPRGG